jgi:hypothetical protein
MVKTLVNLFWLAVLVSILYVCGIDKLVTG